jgi:TatD DNase family protein
MHRSKGETQMNFLDFHCHLDDPAYDHNRTELLNECFASGFSKLVTVADPVEKDSLVITSEAIQDFENIFCTIAVHPHHADRYSPELESRMMSLLENKKTIAIGETGLDYHYQFSSPENQLITFKRQISIARELKIPLIIHAREAEEEVLKELNKEGFEFPVVFHCYTGNKKNAKEILKRGYCISISGIITFKKSNELREIVRSIPLNQIFSETDSPYLSPDPYRGKTNSPLRVKLVAEKIAEIKEIPVYDLNQEINRNFNRLFL